MDICSVNLSVGKGLAQCVRSYRGSDLMVALSKLRTVANSAAFLFAEKCVGNNLVFHGGIAAMHK